MKFSDFGGVPVLKEISIWRFVIERDGIIVINIIINALENNQPNDRANGSSESIIHVRRPSMFVGQNDINVFNHAASRCHSHSVIDRFSIWDRKRRTESPSKIGVAQNGVDVFNHGASRCHSHNVFEGCGTAIIWDIKRRTYGPSKIGAERRVGGKQQSQNYGRQRVAVGMAFHSGFACGRHATDVGEGCERQILHGDFWAVQDSE